MSHLTPQEATRARNTGAVSRLLLAAPLRLTAAAGLVAACAEATGPAPVRRRQFTRTTYAYAGDTTAPSAVLAADAGTRLSVWESAARDRVTQTLHTDAATGTKARVFYGPQGLGAPTRIVDEVTGESVVITSPVNGRVDFLSYDAAARYMSGTAVIYRDAKLYMAPITSRPAFAGQINVRTNRVSLALTASTADSGLGPAVEAPANYTKFLGDALAAPASPAEFGAALTYAGLTWIALTPSAVGPSAVGSPAPYASLGGRARGSRSASARANPAVAVAAGVAVGYALALLEPILQSAFNKITAEVSEKTRDGEAPTTALQKAWAKLVGGDELAGRTLEEFTERAGDLATDLKNGAVDAYRSAAAVPTLIGGPPMPPSSVEGMAVDQSNTVYPVNGTVDGAGRVSVSGTADNGRTLRVDGTVANEKFDGSYNGSPGSGPVSGNTNPLSRCLTARASGGTGTYADAYDMGKATGTVTLTYDAQNVPDAFRVVSYDGPNQPRRKVDLVNTGRVAGRNTVTFALSGWPRVVVLVSAPETDTVWSYSLSCP